MSRGHAREFWCAVVSETVQIRLKRISRFDGGSSWFVQCDQNECQYVEENKPPCPLEPGMFADEMRAAEDARASRRDGRDA